MAGLLYEVTNLEAAKTIIRKVIMTLGPGKLLSTKLANRSEECR